MTKIIFIDSFLYIVYTLKSNKFKKLHYINRLPPTPGTEWGSRGRRFKSSRPDQKKINKNRSTTAKQNPRSLGRRASQFVKPLFIHTALQRVLWYFFLSRIGDLGQFKIMIRLIHHPVKCVIKQLTIPLTFFSGGALRDTDKLFCI